MMARWEDVATRVRGMAPRLLDRTQLDGLARASDLHELAAGLRALGFLVATDGAVTPEALELAVRRAAAGALAIIARWAAGRTALLGVIYEDEDRRSMRNLLRGAVQGAPPEERLAGLLATPALPERALNELARLATPREIAALLTAWGNPYGSALAGAAAAAQPDLLALESQVIRTFAERARRHARGARSGLLNDFVRDTLDLENARTALVLATAEPEIAAEAAFVAGGRRLSLPVFLGAIKTRDIAPAARAIAAAFDSGKPQRGSVADAFARLGSGAGAPGGLEEQLLRARSAALQRHARRDPAGIATILAFVCDLRVQALALDRIIWGVALNAPRTDLVARAGRQEA
jgi:vacuolar-type H+-ATPase subunit C/Vma6